MKNFYDLLIRGFKRLRFVGIRNFLHQKLLRLKNERRGRIWVRKHYPNTDFLKEQELRAAKLDLKPKISILCPIYNTPELYLRECFDSVLAQTYKNWELCVVDDASENSNIRNTIREYAERDSRIKFFFSTTRGHISKASNDALNISTGEYVGFLDHDDILWPNALYEVVLGLAEHPDAEFIYSDEDKLSGKAVHKDLFFKPDWSPHYLRSRNYICHFSVLRRALIEKIGGFRIGFEGAQDWDLFLRATRNLNPGQIVHIPKILYSWRQSAHSSSVAKVLRGTKGYAFENQKKALEEDLKARGYEGNILPIEQYLMWRVRRKIMGNPLVSIVIPTKNQYAHICMCLESILEKTTYRNFELIIVDTGSNEPDVFRLYEETLRRWEKTKILKWNDEFNFSGVCNFGARQAGGEYLVLLNNDTEVLTPDWIEGLLEYAQLPEAGAVGALLFYPNGRIQHAGVILGVNGQSKAKGVADNAYRNSADRIGMRGNVIGIRNYSAVTAACLMVKKSKYFEVGGQDPEFKIAFGDVDFSLKLMKAGYFNVYNGFVQLIHHESVSTKLPGSKGRDMNQFRKEKETMFEKWGDLLQNDPYYNENLTLERNDFSIKI